MRSTTTCAQVIQRTPWPLLGRPPNVLRRSIRNVTTIFGANAENARPAGLLRAARRLPRQGRAEDTVTTQSLRKSVLDIGHRIGRPVLVPPGAKFVLMALCTLPVAVVGLSASTTAETLSGPLAALWLGLLPVALYRRWATIALLFVAA